MKFSNQVKLYPEYKSLIIHPQFNNNDALRWSIFYNHNDLAMQLIRQHGVDLNYFLGIACEYGHLEMVTYLINQGAIINSRCNYPLRIAAQHGYLELCKYLMSQGADFKAKDNWAVRYASAHGHLDVVEYLINLGADIHAKNEFALYYASLNGHLDVVKCLLECGAKIDVRDLYDRVSRNLMYIQTKKFGYSIAYEQKYTELFELINSKKNEVINYI